MISAGKVGFLGPRMMAKRHRLGDFESAILRSRWFMGGWAFVVKLELKLVCEQPENSNGNGAVMGMILIRKAELELYSEREN